MSYNGSGTFNVNTAGQPVVTGTVISSTAFNALTADLATGLSTAITKDGQTTTTVRVPFAAGISSTLTTDATSSTTGSIISSGGISCQKALYVGTGAYIPNLGAANKIINGDMRIAQRSTSATGITGGSYNACDRWNLFQNIATLTVSQDTDVPTAIGVGFSQKYTVTATGSASTTGKVLPCQSIEGFNFAEASFGNANAKSVTISFWAKSSITGTYGVWMRNSAANRYICNTFALTAATWTYVTVTFAGDTSGTWVGATNGIGITVGLCLDAGSSIVGTANTWGASENDSTSSQTHWAATNGATFNVTAFKVELGSIATPFVPDDYSVSLRKCQRYYILINYGTNCYFGTAAAYSTVAAATGFNWGRPLRATPTVTFPATVNWDNSAGAAIASVTTTAGVIGVDNMRVVGSAASGWTAGNASLIEMTGNLTLDSEL